MRNRKSAFVVVANRLPVDRVDDGGEQSWRTSPGGLVTALAPVLRHQDGVWIGWPGDDLDSYEPFEADGLSWCRSRSRRPIYAGTTTACPTRRCGRFTTTSSPSRSSTASGGTSYVRVNRRFAEATAEHVQDNGVVWVQDYQLQLVPEMLRELRPDVRIGFFLHIPFPPTELFKQLPWRDSILKGMLGADLVGFQRPGGAANFARMVRARLGYKTHRDRITLDDGREVAARAYPISIDVKGLEELARTPEVDKRAAEIRADLGNPRWVLLGVDRLDYTKGIRQRLRAFGELIAEGRISVDVAVFVQVASPSRERVGQYQEVRDDIERWVGRINGDLGRIGHPAIHYLHSSYDRAEMAALFRAADIMVVTPFADGMNLVAKEYVTARYEETGALVLSEFAGAADELKQAYLVNPHDINGLKESMWGAMQASPREVRRRMRAMRKQVREHDIDSWASNFLGDLRSTDSMPHHGDAQN